MKKRILKLVSLFLSMIMLCMTLTACGDDNKCGMCNGSGYYQKKTCPACNGSGHSDYDPYEIMDDVYGK